MFRDQYDGADRQFLNFCTRNGPLLRQYLEDAISESENFAQEQKDRSGKSKRAREAEASEAESRKLAVRKAFELIDGDGGMQEHEFVIESLHGKSCDSVRLRLPVGKLRDGDAV